MTPDQSELNAHHVGCLTKDIGKSIGVYREMGFQNISDIYSISSQSVNVCFIEIRKGFYLELVEFSQGNSSLERIFQNGTPYYHVGYTVENMDSTICLFQKRGFWILNKFHSEAFNGRLCVFLYSPEMHLIELIQKGSDE